MGRYAASTPIAVPVTRESGAARGRRAASPSAPASRGRYAQQTPSLDSSVRISQIMGSVNFAAVGRGAVVTALATATAVPAFSMGASQLPEMLADPGREPVVMQPDGTMVVADSADTGFSSDSRLMAMSSRDVARTDLTETAPEGATAEVASDVVAEGTWTASDFDSNGASSISAEINTRFYSATEAGNAALASSENEPIDGTLRQNLADALTGLAGATDAASIEAQCGVVEAATDSVNSAVAALYRDSRMAEAEAAASAALAAGRTYNPSSPIDFGSVGWVDPLPAGRLTSPYGYRSLFGASRMHEGIDLAASNGTTIVAPADGVVTAVDYNGISGYWIEIAHGNGVSTIYRHMYADGVYVREGQAVMQGERIAAVGSNGRSTGPHLHFEVLINGSTTNPVSFFASRGVSF